MQKDCGKLTTVTAQLRVEVALEALGKTSVEDFRASTQRLLQIIGTAGETLLGEKVTSSSQVGTILELSELMVTRVAAILGAFRAARATGAGRLCAPSKLG